MLRKPARGSADVGATLRCVKRAINNLPGVDEGSTITEGCSVWRAASTGLLFWISAAPRRNRLTTASAVSSSKAIQRTMGDSRDEPCEPYGARVRNCTVRFPHVGSSFAIFLSQLGRNSSAAGLPRKRSVRSVPARPRLGVSRCRASFQIPTPARTSRCRTG